jgi:hypothetical protein
VPPQSSTHHAFHLSEGAIPDTTRPLPGGDQNAADSRYLRSQLSFASISTDVTDSSRPPLRQQPSTGSLADWTTASSTRTSDSFPPFRSSLSTSTSGGSIEEPRHAYFAPEPKPIAPLRPLATSHSLPLLSTAAGLDEPPITPGGSSIGLGITSDEPCYPSAVATASRSTSRSGSVHSESGSGARWSLRGNYANVGTNGNSGSSLTPGLPPVKRKSFLDVTSETTDEEDDDEEEELKIDPKKDVRNGLGRAVVVAELGEGKIVRGREDGAGVTKSEVPQGKYSHGS